jgi:alpha-glucosidase
MTASALGGIPHHDGSARFIPTGRPELDATTTLRLLDPVGGASEVRARVVAAGEASYHDASPDGTDAEGAWWRVDVPIRALTTSYRFEVVRNGRVIHVNGAGPASTEPTDACDHRLVVGPAAPDWVEGLLLYQVLVDRFDRSGADDAGRFARWTDDLLEHPAGATQFYGGDLDGIVSRLDHVAGLGMTGLCLTPFFPSPEFHRYSASSFDVVDDVLGGDGALVRLTTALRERGMRCLGDLTLNHTGSTHGWFEAALGGGPERAMYSFRPGSDAYASFQGVENLPKLNYGAGLTHERMYRAPGSVARRWLGPPVRLDGWRVDVASMVGRLGAEDHNQEVAAGFGAAVLDERPDGFVVGEIPHDPSEDIRAGWPGALLDAGFGSPVRRWLSADATTDGHDLHRGLRTFAASIPWQALTRSVGIVGSHDHPRLRSVTGNADRAAVAVFMLMTFPSVPMLFAGDELGVEGETADAGRRPMPWPGTGMPADCAMVDRVRELAALRRSSAAVRRGGFRWLAVDDDAVVYERSDGHDRVLCIATRRPTSVEFTLPYPVAATDALLPSRELVIDGSIGRVSTTDGALYGAWRPLLG